MLCDQSLYFQTLLGLLETVIGLNLSDIPSEYKEKVADVFSFMDDYTVIPSTVMAILTSRLGILWLLNVLFLIGVPLSVSRLSNKKGKVRISHNTAGVS